MGATHGLESNGTPPQAGGYRHERADTLASTANQPVPRASVVDLFCGAGALSHGFLLEGFRVTCGLDIDESCQYPFEENNKAKFIRKDIAEVDPSEIDAHFIAGAPKILIGCAPCQPYARYSRGRFDPKWLLLKEFARLAVEVAPDVLTMENVPQLERFNNGSIFSAFVAALEGAGYHVRWRVVSCADFGVPQSRSRLVVICSKHGRPQLPHPTNARCEYSTVRDAISGMPPIGAGCCDARDRLHYASIMAPINLRRIQASRPGGTWSDWPPELVADCHRKRSGKQYHAVYGRMQWDQLAPTITTQFIGFGNGRFGHPEQGPCAIPSRRISPSDVPPRLCLCPARRNRLHNSSGPNDWKRSAGAVSPRRGEGH